MITVSAECASVLAGAGFTYFCRVESWRNGLLLAADVPVDSGGEETDRSLTVPERVSLTVPRVRDGVDWTPTGADSPLAAKGQQLHVKLGVGLSLGRVEWLTRGRFLVYDTEPDGDALRVTAVGLLELVNEARLISPFQPSSTFAGTLRGLVEPALTVLVDAAITDRSVPSSINYDEDRLGATHELLDAWPATGYVDPEGYLSVVPAAQSTTPVMTLTDGVGGTIITASGGSSREGGANVIVARGQASDGSQVQGTAYVQTGPDAYGGPYNPLPVPFFFQSPLLTTVQECTKAAQTIRDRRQRQSNRAFHVEMVPHPGLQIRDTVALTSARLGLSGELCSVEVLSLPYAAPAGQMPAMALTVRTLA